MRSRARLSPGTRQPGPPATEPPAIHHPYSQPIRRRLWSRWLSTTRTPWLATPGQSAYPPAGYGAAAYPHPGSPGASYPLYAASAPGSPRHTHLAAVVRPPTGHGVFAMALLSMRRAFSLRIDANEILDDERTALLNARPAVTDETKRAFLAWRRSVLFIAALMMVPVVLLHAMESLDQEGMPDGWKAINGFAVFIEACFVIFLWTQVPRWTRWRRNRARSRSRGSSTC